MSNVLIFGNSYDVDMSAMQMESIATDLVFLLKHSGLSRSELASKLGWSKSRITKVLSGDENLTVKTITYIAECLGYAFDVVFYNENYEQPKQPWHIDKFNKSAPALEIHLDDHIELRVQEGNEVFQDMLAGEDASHYIRVGKTFDIDKIRSVHSDVDLSVGKKVLRLDAPISNGYTFNKSLNNKDVEQWITN